MQHRLNEVDLLKGKIHCMARNLKCKRQSLNVLYNHTALSKFNATQTRLTMQDTDLNELIYEKIREYQGSAFDSVDGISSKSWFTKFIDNLEHILITVVAVVLIGLIIIYIMPKLISCIIAKIYI